MEVRACKNCKRLFNYLSGPSICPACRDMLEDSFQKVKRYIQDNPGATIQAVAEENEVSVQQIKQWVREERLEFSSDSPVTLECETCGAPIRTGRYCDACKKATMNAFASQIRHQPQPEASSGRQSRDNKMRFLDN